MTNFPLGQTPLGTQRMTQRLLLDEFTHGDAVSSDMLLDGAAVGVAELGEVIH